MGENRINAVGQVDLDASQTYRRIALAGVIFTIVMILIGAVTRVSGSGMGCGIYWPTCNGQIVPELKESATIIEMGHRIYAIPVGLLAGALLVQAWRRHRPE